MRKMVFAVFVFFVVNVAGLLLCAGCDRWLDLLDGSGEARDTEKQAVAGGEVYPFPFEFSARDVYGEDVTQEVLGEKELFFVHHWATWCGPCVSEMGELAEVAAKYAGKVGFIGLLSDYNDNREGAAKLLTANGAEFLNISEGTPGLEALVDKLWSGFIPTTVIIDGAGNMVGEQIIGAHGAGYGEYIEAALEAVRNPR